MLGYILVFIFFAALTFLGLKITDSSVTGMQKMRRSREKDAIHVPVKKSRNVLWISRRPFLRLSIRRNQKDDRQNGPSGDIAGL